MTVAFTCADDGGSGCSGTEYDLDGGGWAPFSGSFTLTDTGRHTLRYRSRDAAHNVEDAHSVEILITRATKLVFLTSTAAGATGRPFTSQPEVGVEDDSGNLIFSEDSPVSLSITLGTGATGAALTCDANPIAASFGVAFFDGCAIDLAGTGYSLHATSQGLAAADSSTFDVAGAPRAHISARPMVPAITSVT